MLKYCGEYWCYSTGFWHDGRCFGVMHSRNLVDWRELGGAMEPLPGGATCYWAPEVVYQNGRFFMYYSVGNEDRMQIRVAEASHPAGPFIDSGRVLTSEDFAIDAHVFEDDDGERYLFYATDFLTHSHIGTGTVYDRLIDPYTLKGEPRPVTRARFDWQVYDPRRAEKGGVRWHTVEGPTVLKHKGLYYEMFSGGNWKNITYGVSYGVTDHLGKEGEWEQACDGERVLPILRTLPGLVTGPGHNSVARGPDNQQLFCVYHRWSEDGRDRVLCIDRLEWVGERMVVLGPTTTPQPAPLLPAFDESCGEAWRHVGGRWSVRDNVISQSESEGSAEARLPLRDPRFVLELGLRAASAAGAFGVKLGRDSEDALRFRMRLDAEAITCQLEAGGEQLQLDLPEGFDARAYHLLRFEVDGVSGRLSLDGRTRWQGRVSPGPVAVALVTENMAAEFAGFALTIGWQDLFVERSADPAELGWQAAPGGGDWQVRDQQLWQQDPEARHAIIAKGALLDSYELVINARLGQKTEARGCYGFYPALGPVEDGPLLTVERAGEGWSLVCRERAERRDFKLAGDFDPFAFQQFRFRKQGGRLMIQSGSEALGEIESPPGPTRVGLYAHEAAAAFDMVRVTSGRSEEREFHDTF